MPAHGALDLLLLGAPRNDKTVEPFVTTGFYEDSRFDDGDAGRLAQGVFLHQLFFLPDYRGMNQAVEPFEPLGIVKNMISQFLAID